MTGSLGRQSTILSDTRLYVLARSARLYNPLTILAYYKHSGGIRGKIMLSYYHFHTASRIESIRLTNS